MYICTHIQISFFFRYGRPCFCDPKQISECSVWLEKFVNILLLKNIQCQPNNINMSSPKSLSSKVSRVECNARWVSLHG